LFPVAEGLRCIDLRERPFCLPLRRVLDSAKSIGRRWTCGPFRPMRGGGPRHVLLSAIRGCGALAHANGGVLSGVAASIRQGALNGAYRDRRRLARMSPVLRQPSWLPVRQPERRVRRPGRRSAAGGASAVPWRFPGPRAHLHVSRRLVAAVLGLAGECRRAERPRPRWAVCGRDLPYRGPAAGRSSAGRPSHGVTQSRSRW
jgi:hypothetical protein